jgi:hypothetical protein
MLKSRSKVINAGASRNIFKLVWGWSASRPSFELTNLTGFFLYVTVLVITGDAFVSVPH